MFCPKYILFYVFVFVSILFFGLYVWRRIYGMECYTQILEKKVANLKKENKELHCMLSCDKDGKCSVEEADVIMNKIFMQEAKPAKESPKAVEAAKDSTHIVKITNVAPPTKEDPKVPSAPSVAMDPIVDVLEGIVATAMPADNDTENADIESVISDAVNGSTYNRRKLTKMNLDKLKDICSSMNLQTDGTKNMLIERILGQS
jgi:hypothetical protein